MSEAQESIPRITKVRVKHFRSIEDAEFTLEPLTVLVGPNASGKSNLLDVFGLLGDASKDGLESALRRRGGIENIGWKSPSGITHAPEFSFEFFLKNVTVTYSFMLSGQGRWEYKVTREKVRARWLRSDIRSSEISITNGRLTKSTVRRIANHLETIREGNNTEQLGRGQYTLESMVSLIERLPDNSLRLWPRHSQSAMPYLMNFLERMGRSLQNSMLHLTHAMLDAHSTSRKIESYHFFSNALRRPQLMTDSNPLETEAGNLASALYDLLNRQDPSADAIKASLGAVVPDIRDIRVTPAGSHLVLELAHKRLGGDAIDTWFDLYHEADGTIRMLAMLAALYQAPSPSVICLEEPEAGIHPGALAVLADVLNEAVLRSQVIVATHSPELINLLTVNCIRAVSAESGSTKVGPIATHQIKSVKNRLFSAGEIHNMQGLYPKAPTS